MSPQVSISDPCRQHALSHSVAGVAHLEVGWLLASKARRREAIGRVDGVGVRAATATDVAQHAAEPEQPDGHEDAIDEQPECTQEVAALREHTNEKRGSVRLSMLT